MIMLTTLPEIAEVYKVGISPVAQDGNEVIKCYERGCQLAPSVDGLSHFYQSTFLNYTPAKY